MQSFDDITNSLGYLVVQFSAHAIKASELAKSSQETYEATSSYLQEMCKTQQEQKKLIEEQKHLIEAQAQKLKKVAEKATDSIEEPPSKPPVPPPAETTPQPEQEVPPPVEKKAARPWATGGEEEPSLPHAKRMRREWQRDDDQASRSSWQSRGERQKQPQEWICYRCKEACGRDAKHCERPLEELRGSALVDLLDRFQFKGKRDEKNELPRVLALLHERGFRVPGTQEATLELRKCLQSLEKGKTDVIPEEYPVAPERPPVITPGPTITEVGQALPRSPGSGSTTGSGGTAGCGGTDGCFSTSGCEPTSS